MFGEYPGKLRDALGIWVEETDALRPEEKNRIVTNGHFPLPRKEYACSFLCDLIHARAAEPLAVYGDDFYAGMPCVTKNAFGKGTAYYIGTQPEDAFLGDLMSAICESAGIEPVFSADAGVEITRRVNEKGAAVFVLNHNQDAAQVRFGEKRLVDLLTGEPVTGTRTVAGRDVMILREEA